MPKRKDCAHRETKEEFYERGIYRTSHRRFARMSRGSRTPSSRKKQRTQKKAHRLSDEQCRVLFSERKLNDPSLRRLRASSASTKHPKTSRARGGKTFTFKSTRGAQTMQSFNVTEEKHLFLVQGNLLPAGTGRYDYLSEVYMHGNQDLLPSVGESKEILPTPMTPGVWNVGDVGSSNALQQQSDWEGKRLCLFHEDFPAAVVSRAKADFRFVRTKPHFDQDVGSLALLPFDGFDSTEEAQTYQGTLAAEVLGGCRNLQGSTNNPVVCVPSIRFAHFKSCGGVSIAVHIRASESSPFYIKLTTHEATNLLVAAELVFPSTCTTTSRKSESSSLPGLPLTTKNVKQHALCTGTAKSTKLDLAKLVNQHQDECQKVDPQSFPKPLLALNRQNQTPPAQRRKAIQFSTESSKTKKLRPNSHGSLSSSSSFPSTVQFGQSNKEPPQFSKKPFAESDTDENQVVSVASFHMDQGSPQKSIAGDEYLGVDDMYIDSSPIGPTVSFGMEGVANQDSHQGELHASQGEGCVQPRDVVSRELFPRLPEAIVEGDGQNPATNTQNHLDFFHDAYFGLHDPHDNTSIVDFQDEDLMMYAQEPAVDAEFHDVIFGRAKVTSVLEWIFGVILLGAFFRCAYLARPFLYALTRCCSGEDEVDFDSILLAGEGFAEFVYNP